MELCYRERPLVLWDWLIVFFLQVKCDSTGQHFKNSEALGCYYLFFCFSFGSNYRFAGSCKSNVERCRVPFTQVLLYQQRLDKDV